MCVYDKIAAGLTNNCEGKMRLIGTESLFQISGGCNENNSLPSPFWDSFAASAGVSAGFIFGIPVGVGVMFGAACLAIGYAVYLPISYLSSGEKTVEL